jgi:hypothetical protein
MKLILQSESIRWTAWCRGLFRLKKKNYKITPNVLEFFLETAHPIKFWCREPAFKRKLPTAQIESVCWERESKHKK